MQETDLERDIREKRKLPYMLTVEKEDKESGKIYVRNTWGSRVIYRRTPDDNYEIVKD
jgi:nitrogen fixation protein